MLITNAKIITMSDLRPFGGIIENGFIKIRNGKIFDIGKMSDLTLADVNSENSVENMSGCTILPGFIDAHTHLGLCRAGETYSDSDINRSSDISPQHSPIPVSYTHLEFYKRVQIYSFYTEPYVGVY